MPWFAVDDGFYDHPKVIGVSMAARGLWTTAGSYCAKHMTDGLISARTVRQLGGTAAQIRHLLDAGLWIEETDDQNTKHYRISGYLNANRSRVQIQNEREAARKRKAKSRGENATTSNNTEMSRRDSRPPSQFPIPSHPLPNKERGANGGEDSSPTPPLTDSLYETFPDHCQRHRHTPPGETGPCGGCKAQREANQRLADQSKDDQIALEAHRIAGIADCDYCADDGTHPYIKRSNTGGLFEYVKNCQHSDQDRQDLDEVMAFREKHGDTAA